MRIPMRADQDRLSLCISGAVDHNDRDGADYSRFFRDTLSTDTLLDSEKVFLKEQTEWIG